MEGIKILLYHSVGTIDPGDNLGIRVDKDNFSRQMKFLKEGKYNICTLGDAVDCIKAEKEIPQKTAVITFDDGYKDNITDAAPIMERFDFPATFFVTIDYIGVIKTSPHRQWQRWGCMDYDDLKALINRGHNIESHSLHHINLRGLPKDEKERELKISKEKISTSLNRAVDFFSYPYGYFDEELLTAAKRAGYKAACITAPGINSYSTNLYKLKRIEITAKDSEEEFRYKLEDRYEG